MLNTYFLVVIITLVTLVTFAYSVFPTCAHILPLREDESLGKKKLKVNHNILIQKFKNLPSIE